MTTLTEVAPAGAAAHEQAAERARPAAAYMNPYLAGIGLGLVLLLSYLVMGRGLGASGAFSSVCAVVVEAVSPASAASNSFWREYLEAGVGHPLKAWLVFEVLGVLVGGLLSGLLARRVKAVIEKGPRISTAGRFGFAFAGGALMGIGAKLARGCTSGQALSGGAVLSAGSWAFMLMVFAGAYGAAWFLRRQWR